MKLGNGLGLQYYRASGETPILDSFPGAQVAYSLHYLSSSYSGDVVLVRRSSDNSELGFTPTEINDGTLLTWVGGGNNGFVKTWYDQSGNANNATNSTNSEQPRIVISGSLITENGLPAIQFTSAHVLSYSVISTGITAVVVCRVNGGAFTWDYIIGNTNADSGLRVNQGDYRTPATSGDWYNGGALHVNGSTSPISATSQHISFAVGTGISVTSISSLFNGRGLDGIIQEAIVYTSDQSANRAAIETAINSYYNSY